MSWGAVRIERCEQYYEATAKSVLFCSYRDLQYGTNSFPLHCCSTQCILPRNYTPLLRKKQTITGTAATSQLNNCSPQSFSSTTYWKSRRSYLYIFSYSDYDIIYYKSVCGIIQIILWLLLVYFGIHGKNILEINFASFF